MGWTRGKMQNKPKNIENSNGLYILLEAGYWTYNIAYRTSYGFSYGHI